MHIAEYQNAPKTSCLNLLYLQLVRVLFLFLFSNFFIIHSKCQPIENRFTHYTAADGLSEGDKGCILQDSTGYIWIGTENGLARFDGYNFKIYRYNFKDTNSLRENRIIHLYLDNKKRLWAISFHWLFLYHPDGEWFEHFSIYETNNDMLVHICDEVENKLIITGHQGLYEFDELCKKFKRFTIEGISLANADNYQKDEHGIDWISGGFGLVRYDPKTKQINVFDSSNLNHAPNENIAFRKIILLPDDNLLASSYNFGLVSLNRKTFVSKHHPLNKINPFYPITSRQTSFVRDRSDCMYRLNDSIILCSVGGGLSILNLHNDNVNCFLPEKLNPVSLMEKDIRIWSIFKDREGIIWLGGKNIEKYDYKDYTFNNITAKATELPENVFAIFGELFRTSSGKFLMGNNGGMNLFDPVSNRLIDLSDIPYRRITNFNEDAYGNIWCYKNGCLSAFALKNNKINNLRQFKFPYNIKGLYDIKLDHKGRVLIATSSGLIIFDTSSKQFNILTNNSPPPMQLNLSSCTVICCDHNGCDWIGTINGLNKIDKDGFTVTQYNKNKKLTTLLKDCWITDIKEDNHGIIWLATNEHGIGRLDPAKDSLSFVSLEQGLPTCKFDKICIDNHDNLWALTANGNIVILNTLTLINRLCTEQEGFPAPDDVMDLFVSPHTNCLYILTAKSIIEVGAKITNPNTSFPSPIITSFSVFDKEKTIGQGNKVELNYKENFINIQFACLLFHNNSQIKYAYKLDGVDKDWVCVNYKRYAPYTDLDPGKYIFHVKAQNPDGIWNDKPTQLIIIIKPPFWQTWWFYLFEILVIAGVAVWIFRLYIKRKLAQQKLEFEKNMAVADERLRIASDIHDDLGAGLTSIRLLSEIANLKTTHESTAKTEIEKIVKSAENLSDNLKEIIWTMKTEHDKLNDFIIYIRSYAIEFFEDSNIEFLFNPSKTNEDRILPGELRRNILLCIKEGLNNIVKHAHASQVSMSVEVDGDILVIEIKDDGIGIDFDKTNKYANGLTTMKKRLEKFGGSMVINVHNGTQLVFKVPIKNPE